MTNLLDEGIDQHQSMDWTCGNRVVRTLSHGTQYQCIANTIVQLIRHSNLGSNRFTGADSVGRATLKKTGVAAPLLSGGKR
jgi:hypothetical protein